MELSFKPIPLVLTSSKVLSPHNDSGIVKKRKLSECSDVSNSNSESNKSSLNEKFLELSLDNPIKFHTSDDSALKMEPIHTINIPKPVRLNQGRQEESPPKIPEKSEQFLENLIKMSQNDISGISKYLNLDLNAKMSTWDKLTANPSQKEKFKMGSVFTSFLNSPFNNLPFLRPELFNSQKGLSSDSPDGSGSGNSDNDIKFAYTSTFIGPLTQNQRREKVEKYQEKKKSRKWKHIRYNVRKDLADKRERVQGRFVKTPKTFSHSDLMEKVKSKEDGKILIENNMRNNSDIIVNGLSLSSSLGKRTNKADLFYDT